VLLEVRDATVLVGLVGTRARAVADRFLAAAPAAASLGSVVSNPLHVQPAALFGALRRCSLVAACHPEDLRLRHSGENENRQGNASTW